MYQAGAERRMRGAALGSMLLVGAGCGSQEPPSALLQAPDAATAEDAGPARADTGLDSTNDAAVASDAGWSADRADAAGSEGGAPLTPSFDAGACGAQPPVNVPSEDTCGNGLDDDYDGFVDENCGCEPGTTQACFGGRPEEVELPNCRQGSQACEGQEFAGWGSCQGWSCDDTPPPEELCDNALDDDCDGVVDEGCELDVPVDIDGDCVEAACPPQAPYPRGCELMMEGGDSRGCVANAPGESSVYFQEGDQCPLFPGINLGDVGHISGTLLCGTQPPEHPLDASSCPLNKSEALYPSQASDCP